MPPRTPILHPITTLPAVMFRQSTRVATAKRDLLLAKQSSLVAPDSGAEEALHPRTDQRGRELSAAPSSAPRSSSQSIGEPEEESGNDGTEADAQDEDENAEKPAAKSALQGGNHFISQSMQRSEAQTVAGSIHHTNEIYFSPNFDGTVNDPENRVELGKIVKKIRQDWTSQESRSRNTHISEAQVLEMVKESFRTVKKDWRRHFTPELKIKLEEQHKRDRRIQRRVRKSAQLLSLVADYANENQLVASVLRDALDEQYSIVGFLG
ncbi:hypothetical protein MVEN_02321400 [Mycena venus]|uniref:Uncharacterized protein n=1 Tax=Mycena venus TaxID=2733690 RepID=A0A8H7CG19_9AGAR|nr:hypothetical protein MVEN_02321400 [Mycena venus]